MNTMDPNLKLSSTSSLERYNESLVKLNFQITNEELNYKKYKFGDEKWGGETCLLCVSSHVQIKHTRINVKEDFSIEFKNNGSLDYEFIICTKGLSFINCPCYFKDQIKISKGIFLLKEGMHTSTIWHYPGNQIHETFTLKISKEWLESLCMSYRLYGSITNVLTFLQERPVHDLVFKSGNFTANIRRLIDSLILQPIKDDFGLMHYESIANQWISSFLSNLDLICYDHWIHSNCIEKFPVSKQSLRKIERIQSAIRSNLSVPPNLKKLSKDYGISQSSLQVGFQYLYGCTIFEFIRKIRIAYSKKYLLENHSVIETARYVGYKDTSHFIIFFKKYTGITPKQFQKLKLKSK